MEIIPANFQLDEGWPVLSTHVNDHPNVSDRHYEFRELYDSDFQCDCRKTIIDVRRAGLPEI